MYLENLSSTIISFCDKIVNPLLLLVGIWAILYFAYLVFKIIFCLDSKQRANNIEHLFTAVFSYFVIFFMIFTLGWAMPTLNEWAQGNTEAKLDISTFNVNIPFIQAKSNLTQSADILEDQGVPVYETIDQAKDVTNQVVDTVSNTVSDTQTVSDTLGDTIGDTVDTVQNIANTASDIANTTEDIVNTVADGVHAVNDAIN